MNRWMHEQAAPGGDAPAAFPVPAPPAPPPSPAEIDAAREERIALKLALALGLMGLVTVAVPLYIAQSRQSASGPAREVQAQGFHMRYTAPLGSKKVPVDYYIGTGSDGRCHIADRQADWDTGLCEVRLRQISADGCNAVPLHNDEHCRAMMLGASPGQARAREQAGAERRAARIMFLVREGARTTASELP